MSKRLTSYEQVTIISFNKAEDIVRSPRAPRSLSNSAKKKLVEKLHRNRSSLSQNLVPLRK